MSSDNVRPRSTPDLGNSSPAKKRPYSSQSAPAPYLDNTVFPDAPKVASFSQWNSSKCWSMGAKLSVPAPRSKTPGPGAYSPGYATLPSAPRYSISPRFDRKLQEKTMAFVPGPGAYVPINPAHKPRNVAIGQKLSFGDPFSKSQQNRKSTPGPGEYDVVEVTTFAGGKALKGGNRGAPMWSFGLKTSHITGGVPINNTPGPGTYSCDERAERGPAYSMNPRLPARRGFQTPGPGAYDISYGATHKGRFDGVRTTLHSRLRPQLSSNAFTPGPGQYEAPQQFWGPSALRPHSSAT